MPPTPSTAASDWTPVLRRRSRRNTPRSPPPPSPPLPWSPTPDPTTPLPTLLPTLRRTISTLQSSAFYQTLLSDLPAISPVSMVLYGVGPLSSAPSRLQLALALLLHSRLSLPSPLLVFDPVLSVPDCDAISSLGASVLPVNEHGRRKVSAQTLFYMPHCEAGLYDGLLEANWSVEGLNRVVVLGNSFREYVEYVEGFGKGSRVEGEAQFVVRASKVAEERPVECGKKVVEADGAFFKAFHSTSWHFFGIDEEGFRSLQD